LCIDMRYFYASIEDVRLGLDPMKVMLAVVGDISRSGSIVLAASPTLKKKHGISNVSRFYELPDDPDIYIVEANMADYLHTSLKITKLLNTFVPKEAIHPYSIDEVWVTVNGLKKLYDNRFEVANQIQQTILNTLCSTCVVRIGDNKFLAKVVMELHVKKVSKGIAESRYEHVETMLCPFPVKKIWGIGSRIERNLYRMGITTLGQITE